MPLKAIPKVKKQKYVFEIFLNLWINTVQIKKIIVTFLWSIKVRENCIPVNSIFWFNFSIYKESYSRVYELIFAKYLE